ncbi:rhomboid-related protein 1 [Candidatus Vecturithrix granuli]|uniref:Rhomboid-related protein 1 n=1 Tax=Vecturithrix granuli TaxID=1499967 RepID=A0A0S6WAU6_VECG1|nr:rhomboid-related protein 1 [Candidatus Vecturithrix granuli]
MNTLQNKAKLIQYNSPVILTFSLLAVAVHLVNMVFPHFTIRFFATNPFMSLANPLDYFRLVSYVLGHANWEHLFGNLSFILLLGPILEEKYGSKPMLVMILLTALFTGLINVVFFRSGLMGASGIVFMLILLASIVDVKAGAIPLTFVLVVAIFIGRELVLSFRADQISQMGHILGGACGAFFGFVLLKPLNARG